MAVRGMEAARGRATFVEPGCRVYLPAALCQTICMQGMCANSLPPHPSRGPQARIAVMYWQGVPFGGASVLRQPCSHLRYSRSVADWALVAMLTVTSSSKWRIVQLQTSTLARRSCMTLRRTASANCRITRSSASIASLSTSSFYSILASLRCALWLHRPGTRWAVGPGPQPVRQQWRIASIFQHVCVIRQLPLDLHITLVPGRRPSD